MPKEHKRISKFKFKREIKEIVLEIHMSNKLLFPLAAMRSRGNQSGDPYDYSEMLMLQYSAGGNSAGRNSSFVNNFINYDNDNFFETEDDRLIVTRKIQDVQHFWERIDAFFKVNISKELLG